MDGITLERLGNLHLVFLHLPIGFVVAAVLLELWRWRRPSVEGAWLQGRLLAANAVASLLTAGAGLLLASGGNYSGEVLALHRWAGVTCAALAIAAWMAHARGGKWAGRVMLFALLVATIVAGHLGATLTHGSAVTVWWRTEKTESKKTTVAVHPIAADAPVFEKEIRPLLERSCFECHGPLKARGRLRLDTREAALAGGKSGLPAITPGKPEASELLRRIKLPRDDDEAMPAGDALELTPAEIARLEKWIVDGASWR
ncbi:c-type cytochrome domain-containing protein [Rariglobus hedericola]|nr:c-type cytochrome domain-containing protein [Rariglobus hedericola]